MPRVIHFDLRGENTERTIKFYTDVFGWKFNKWEGPMEYWLIEAGDEDEEGINGGLMKREEPEDQIFNYIQVSNVDETKNKIEKSGGTIVSPRTTVPGVGHFYMFKDTEGNKLGIMEEDENTK